jgi:hypothetical protein
MPRRPRKATAMANGKVSPKTIIAAAMPALVALVAVLIQWAVTGEYNRPELATLITGLATSLLTGLGSWLAEPGEVVVQIPDRVEPPTP